MSRCSYCGSLGHPVSHCPKTYSGSVRFRDLKCGYCGQKGHNTDACRRKWPGPNPIRVSR